MNDIKTAKSQKTLSLSQVCHGSSALPSLPFKKFQEILCMIDDTSFLIEILKDSAKEYSNLDINIKDDILTINYRGYFKSIVFVLSEVQEICYDSNFYSSKRTDKEVRTELELDMLSNISINTGTEVKYYFVAKVDKTKENFNTLTLEIPMNTLTLPMINCGKFGMYDSYEEIEAIQKEYMPASSVDTANNALQDFFTI